MMFKDFPIRYSIHGPDIDGTWTLTAYRFKWELCPKEGSYVPYRGPFEFKSLKEVVEKVTELDSAKA